MTRIQQLFKTKQTKVLNIYCTAGYPRFESTLKIMKALQENGADMVELGMPYSDPLADGPVIQESSKVALQQGMTIKQLFDQIKNMRHPDEGIRMPVVLMGYMNPVMQYGFEKFCAEAAATGVDGLILPDLPLREFETEYSAVTRKHGLDFIFLVTPETSEERIRRIDALSTGFIYAVSSSSTTGTDKDFSDVERYLQRLKHMELKNPVLVGFGIKDKGTFESACKFANGAIIGSAYIKALEKDPDEKLATKKFLKSVLA